MDDTAYIEAGIPSADSHRPTDAAAVEARIGRRIASEGTVDSFGAGSGPGSASV